MESKVFGVESVLSVGLWSQTTCGWSGPPKNILENFQTDILDHVTLVTREKYFLPMSRFTPRDSTHLFRRYFTFKESRRDRQTKNRSQRNRVGS